MIEIERFLAALLTPLPVLFVLFCSGILLVFNEEKANLGKGFLTIGVIIFLLCSMPFISKMLINPIEEKYKPNSNLYTQLRSDINNSGRPLKWIVVLAGGITNDENLPLTSKLSYATLSRIVEGIRLYKKFPGSKLLFSGGSPNDGKDKESDIMKELAIELGIDKTDITTENKSLETSEQVIEIRKIVKKDNFVLVTSANHMPRAVAMFNKKGLQPYLMPSDYLLKKSDDESGIMDFLPSGYSFQLMEQAFYEIWAKVGAIIKGDT